jgi:ribosome-binding factor A
MPDRKIRYAEEIKRALADMIQRDLKDPRIHAFTSITNVEVTKDLSMCKIYISTFGTGEDTESSVKGLSCASGYIRKELCKRVKLRAMPELVFVQDDSIKQGIRISKLIEDTLHGGEKRGS